MKYPFYTKKLQKTLYPHIYMIEKVLKGNKLSVKWFALGKLYNPRVIKADVIKVYSILTLNFYNKTI